MSARGKTENEIQTCFYFYKRHQVSSHFTLYRGDKSHKASSTLNCASQVNKKSCDNPDPEITTLPLCLQAQILLNGTVWGTS